MRGKNADIATKVGVPTRIARRAASGSAMVNWGGNWDVRVNCLVNRTRFTNGRIRVEAFVRRDRR